MLATTAAHAPNVRSIIATGGPPPPATVSRISAVVAPDLMVLARSDDTLWGSPLDPVFALVGGCDGAVGMPITGLR